MKLLLAGLFALLATIAQAQVSGEQFTITITPNPACTNIALSNLSVVTNGPNNAGLTVGAITVTSNPPGGSYLGTITLGGTNASDFTVTNGGKLPANLIVGPTNLAGGTYSITLSCN